MDSNRFDTFTRQLASGVSRRQVLKGIVSFALGSVLANFGFTRQANAYAPENPSQTFEDGLFLPQIARVCEQASGCGTRKNCGDGCLCVRTTEGDIRCGKLPSTCHVPLCKSSSECASLGEGYFCDTPNSGCCTDPPATLSRCIAPCTPACPAANVCGDLCCAEGETCQDGACVNDCQIESITVESMRAAFDALKAGVTSANLSPGGCIQLKQTLSNGAVVAKSMTVDGKILSNWTKSASQWSGQRDSDLDGFFEWKSVTTYSATPGEFQTVETNYSPTTKLPLQRTTLTSQGDVVHTLVEETDNAGMWQTVEEYDADRIQGVMRGDIPRPEESETSDPSESAATCEANPCDPEALRNRTDEGINFALQCLSDFGQRGTDIYEAAINTMERTLTYQCAPIAGETEAHIGGWDDPQGPLEITVDPVKYCKLDDGGRAWLLFHEILHAAVRRGHDAVIDSLDLEHRKQIDRIYGCLALCYTNKTQATKCMCAKCLNTVTCDPICAAFNSDCGATCPCPARFGTYYPACSTCLALCPAGLSCFGFSSCDPVGQSPVCPPVTCGA